MSQNKASPTRRPKTLSERWHNVQTLIETETKTDAEIYQMALEEWLGVLVRLWTAFQKQPTPDQLDLYRNQLDEIPLELLEQAVKRAIRDYKYGNVPSVHDVWEALRKVLDLSTHDDVGEAIAHWTELRWDRLIYRVAFVAVETESV